MKTFYEYYDLDFKQKLNIKNFEDKKKVKLYVAESLDDLLKNSDHVKHSNDGLIQIFLDSPIRLYLDLKEDFIDIRKFEKNLFYFFNVTYEYKYSYFLSRASENFHSEKKEIGFNPFLYEELVLKNSISRPIAVNSTYLHYKNQKVPELIQIDLEQGFNKRKPKKRKEENSPLENLKGLVYKT